MLDVVDDFLNRTTMYRLVLYYLLALFAAALGLSFLGILHYNPLFMLVSAAVVVAVCLLVHAVFARVFEAPANAESTLITALILALIITPLSSAGDLAGWSFLFWASVLAVASKYILAVDNKHLFNPAALAVALTSVTLGLSASWWVGSVALLPFVLAGGFLVVRKLRRFDLVSSFLMAAVASTFFLSVLQGGDALAVTWRDLAYSSMLFFAVVMITEPLTSPPGRTRRVAYGLLVGVLFAPQLSFLGVYSTPELALLVGNVFSYLSSPKGRRILELEEKVQRAPGLADFSFVPDKAFDFKPGQYLELTLGHANPDDRGNRRYFTIASSPTEGRLRFGVKFYPESSSFKKALASLAPGQTVVASQLAGDFTLPDDPDKKLAFIAGGIGITPFRSMVKYLVDRNQLRSIVLLYANKRASDIVYSDVFGDAGRRMDLRTVYALTDATSAPRGWAGPVGPLSAEMVREQIPDFSERLFYVSGPHSMVVAVENLLKQMGVPARRIKTDFFPGFT